jgi:alkanesulfonate monooxygenase SsuD/methylene tetrahydromethanopterin reductase-like flavin-dependent oxidoreductase (luciferase family)
MRPENLGAAARSRSDYRDMTMADVERKAETLPWGTAAEVRDRIIEDAEHAGAETVLMSFNRGAMPHEMFVEQIRRFAKDVLPALQAHQITTVPFAAGAVT